MIYERPDLKYHIALSHFSKFGPKRLSRIFKYFKNTKAGFKANINELKRAGIEEKIADEFIAMRAQINIDKILETLDKEKITVIIEQDERYPGLLKEIYSPPALLYVKGMVNSDNDLSLAIVGTRKYTPYGKQACVEIVSKLSRHKLSIVSGLALGIDTFAHQTCLDCGGHTIAVLGTGIDNNSIYPSVNRFLNEKIIAGGGAVISEFPLGTKPWRFNFPQRNRIISGLSLGTIVIEAKERSGALITAACALEQNREVFALPGNIFSENAKGPNNLIKQGAQPVLNVDDIIETFNLKQINRQIDNKKIIPESKEETELLDKLKREPTHVNELIRLTKQPSSAIIATLTIMEMKGMVKNLGGMKYVLI
ncbi:MAG: DNA-processing protein DprA [Patescibacteria group bacterium]|nr:DNA-processing protein DprA [Patescibacteria group bacterium]